MSGTTSFQRHPWQITEELDCVSGARLATQITQHAETLLCVGNGYLGVRGSLEETAPSEQLARMPTSSVNLAHTAAAGGLAAMSTQGFGHSHAATYINGIYDERPLHYPYEHYSAAQSRTECFVVPVPQATELSLFVGNDEFNLNRGQFTSHERHLRFDTATLHRSAQWVSPSGHDVTIRSKRIAPMQSEHAFLQVYEVTKGLKNAMPVVLRLVSKLTAPRYFCGGDKNRSTTSFTEASVEDARLEMECRTAFSGLAIRCAVMHQLGVSASSSPRQSFGSTPLGSSLDREQSDSREGSSTLLSSADARGMLAPTRVDAHDTEDEHCAFAEWVVSLSPGQSITLTKYVQYVTTRETLREDLSEVVVQSVRAMVRQGASDIFQQHENFMLEFWRKSDVAIEGCVNEQCALRLNILHLLMSSGRTPGTNVAPKGLTGELLCGHFSWDSEAFIFPFFVFNFLPVARQLIQFRIDTLKEAKDRASDLDLSRGAIYPFRTINGTECAASASPTLRLHMNADISFAIETFAAVTGDDDIVLKGGAAVVLATALVWLEWGIWEGDEFHIRHVTGPDDYKPLVHDDCYTNLMAQQHLRYAAKIARQLYAKHPTTWADVASVTNCNFPDDVEAFERAASSMFIPFDPKKHLHLQDESFLKKKPWSASPMIPACSNKRPDAVLIEQHHPLAIYRHQLCKQADVVLCQVALNSNFTMDEKRASFAFYESLTTQDSSLTASTFSIMASELRDTAKALYYFRTSLLVDIDNVVGNTGSGIHASAMAGSWSSVARGFAGMRYDNSRLRFDPYLPEGWEGYNFCVSYANATIQVSVRRRHATYTAIDGKSCIIYHKNLAVHLSRGKPVVVSLINDLRATSFDAVVFDLDVIVPHVEDDHFEAWKLVIDPFLAEEASGGVGIGSVASTNASINAAPLQQQPQPQQAATRSHAAAASTSGAVAANSTAAVPSGSNIIGGSLHQAASLIGNSLRNDSANAADVFSTFAPNQLVPLSPPLLASPFVPRGGAATPGAPSMGTPTSTTTLSFGLTKEQYLAYICRQSATGTPFKGLQQFLEKYKIVLPLGHPDDVPSARTIWGLANRKRGVFREVVARHGVRLAAGAVEIIKALHLSGIAVGCASQSSNAGWLIQQTPVAPFIDVLLGGREIESLRLKWKPEADVFHTVVRMLSCTASRTILWLDDVSGFPKRTLQEFALLLCSDKDHSLQRLAEIGIDRIADTAAAESIDTLDEWCDAATARGVLAGQHHHHHNNIGGGVSGMASGGTVGLSSASRNQTYAT